MRFSSFVLKNVFRRRVRSGLTVMSMAVAVGAVVALVGISNSSVDSFLAIYRNQKIAIIVQQRGAKQRLTSTLSDKLGDKIAEDSRRQTGQHRAWSITRRWRIWASAPWWCRAGSPIRRP